MATVNHITKINENPFHFFPSQASLAKPILPSRNIVETVRSSAFENKLIRLKIFLDTCSSSNIDKDICVMVTTFLDSIKLYDYNSGYDIDLVASTTLEGEIALDIHFAKTGLSASNLLSVLFRKQGIQLEGRLRDYYYDINEELGKEYLTVQELLTAFNRYVVI